LVVPPKRICQTFHGVKVTALEQSGFHGCPEKLAEWSNDATDDCATARFREGVGKRRGEFGEVGEQCAGGGEKTGNHD
jgi:hypothetical protein